jgi:hypothetical protein
MMKGDESQVIFRRSVVAEVAVALSLGGCGFRSEGRRIEQQEIAARSTIGMIHRAESLYLARYGEFAETLTQLGPPASSDAPGPKGAGLIPGKLASTGVRLGYKFTLMRTGAGYTINATPLTFGITGDLTFFSATPGRQEASMIVYEHHGPEPASRSDAEVKSAFKPCAVSEPYD